MRLGPPLGLHWRAKLTARPQNSDGPRLHGPFDSILELELKGNRKHHPDVIDILFIAR